MLVQSKLLTVGEVALWLRQSHRSVRTKINNGDLPALRLGSGSRAPIRIAEDELEAWLHSSGAHAQPEVPVTRGDPQPAQRAPSPTKTGRSGGSAIYRAALSSAP